MRHIRIGAIKSRVQARDVLLTFGFTALTVLAARTSVHLPFTPVPVTMQTLAAILAGMLLGSRLGALSQLQYLALGLAGAPVFANPPHGGPAAVLSPSFGYIPGFVVGAFLAGWSWEKLGRRGLPNAALAGALGAAAIYAAGVPWYTGYLMLTTGRPATECVVRSWLQSAAPFIGVDAFKVAAAAAIVSRLRLRRP